MSITPVNLNHEFLQQATAVGNRPSQATVPFQSMFESVMAEIDSANALKEQDAYDLALGNVDDPAMLTLHSTKADLAFQTFVELRNKLLDAYSEIMRLSL